MLKLNILNIKDVKFGEKTAISDRELYINNQELQMIIAGDKRFSQVEIELVHPGDNCRVVQIFDLVEPRFRVAGENFPGILGKLKSVGEGTTVVLRGTSVLTVDYTSGPRGMLFDMAGPIAKMNIYSDLHHIVLLCHPAEGISRSDYQNALRVANLKAAVYLAKTGVDIPADSIETYDLPSLSKTDSAQGNLPRIVYIYQIQPLQLAAGEGEPVFYGDNVMGLLPTIVHPNEIFDGAVVRGYYGRGQETISVQNHAMIKELYKRHGKDLFFIGVIIGVATKTEIDRERAALITARLAKTVLGADGAVLTKIGGGAPHIDMGWTAEALEEAGVKTVTVVQEESYDMTSAGALLYSSEKVDAVVNVGSYDRKVKLPSIDRVIGGPVNFAGNLPANGEIEVGIFLLCGAMNQIGASKLMVLEV